VEWRDDSFTLYPETRIFSHAGQLEEAKWLARALEETTGVRLEIVERGPSQLVKSEIRLCRIPELADEGYFLYVDRFSILLAAASPAGIFRAWHTLRQLMSAGSEGKVTFSGVDVRDKPRFAWRGVMLDCSRTFQSIEYLKKTIDRMAEYKLNVLHLHLTDDQGWRIEIDAYPELTGRGARFPERFAEPAANHGFYSKAEIRDLVRYAGERFVTIVPEIEMPGHSLAALSCYPELSCTGGPFEIYPFFQGPGITKEIFCAGNDKTFAFFDAVIDEVVELFPSEFVHVGGDEVPKERWQQCPKCQARMRDENLADVHELQSWFIRRAEAMLEARDRRLIGWDEILEGGLAPKATVMSWRGTKGGIAAARAGHDVVMSPTSHCYFDYTYGRIDSERAYSFEPVPAELTREEGRHVLGLQANFWSHIDREPALVDRQLFPRLLAIAERGWSAKEVRDWPDFRRRLQAHLPRLVELGIRYHALDLLDPVARWTPDDTPADFTEVEWDVSSTIDEPGDWRVLFQYEGGAHRLEIESVSLIEDGEVLATDEHLAYTGARDVDNTFLLRVPRERPAGGTILRARIRGGGGVDSTGSVYVY